MFLKNSAGITFMFTRIKRKHIAWDDILEREGKFSLEMSLDKALLPYFCSDRES